MAWGQSDLNEQSTNAGSSTVDDLLTTMDVAQKRRVASILRILIDFHYSSVTANAQIFGRFGLVVVHDDAMAASALPDPLTDDESSWMINQHFHHDQPDLNEKVEHYDLRSRRRFPSDLYTVALILQNSVSSNAAMEWGMGLRYLYTIK